ncbi:putative ephC [Mycobacterium avium subsp. avium 2285 (R)]|nr:putative ephC [Mycobacterium avium subsp. avium 2285 (R)]
MVAPFMRGYAPSAIPSDGSYHVGALMDDALRVRAAAGGTENDVVIGHDWGRSRPPAWPPCPTARSPRRCSCRCRPRRRSGGAAAARPSGPAGRPSGPPGVPQLVHHVLPIALAA